MIGKICIKEINKRKKLTKITQEVREELESKFKEYPKLKGLKSIVTNRNKEYLETILALKYYGNNASAYTN